MRSAKLTKEEFDAVLWALYELMNSDDCEDAPQLKVLQKLVNENRQ